MLPSSSGLSTHSNQSQRPTSALSQRPPSSASHRSLSSASHRPPSSLSSRPLSSASVRPISRISQRPHSRHARSRLLPICQVLVSQVTGLREEDDDGVFRAAVEHVVKNLENTTITKGAIGVDISAIDRQVHGHAQKARINSRDTFAEALQTCYKRLKYQAGQDKDLDQEIQMSRLPDHLQFLMTLSSAATPATLAFAEAYLEGIRNPPPPTPGLTWADIFGDESFDAESSNSGASLSPLNSDDLELYTDDDSLSSIDPEDVPEGPISATTPAIVHNRPPHTYAHRKDFEQMLARQYWRDDHVWNRDTKGKARAFDIGDASTLGPTLQRVLASERGSLSVMEIHHERYIDEQDAVREILMALQGRKNIMLTLIDGSFEETHSTPKLIHLSLTSQSSLISELAQTATIAQQLRNFVAFVFSSSTSQGSHARAAQTRSSRMTRTLEAFADAVDAELRQLDKWCAAQEEAMCRVRTGGATAGTKVVVSLLRTHKALQDKFENAFAVLADVLDTITIYEYRRYALRPRTPAALSALLLDTLLEMVQVYRERAGRVTADILMRVFATSAEPVWAMVGRWLKVGMGMGLGQGEDLDDEFFIESSGLAVGLPGLGLGVGLLDPEFWAEGYVLRDGVVQDDDDADEVSARNVREIPLFLEHVAIPVLGSGKAVGLLRALGVPPAEEGPATLSNWRSFDALLASDAGPDVSVAAQQLSSVSVATLSQLVYEELAPHCEATGALLSRILVEECNLLQHLSSVEDLFLMRRGDVMTNFSTVLFAKMDSQQAWGDFHFLNTAFRDIVEAGAANGAKEWIQSSLVRLSYRGPKDGGRSVSRSVKAISGLLVEYAVPFPIAYIFPPQILQVYGEVLVFLLQIRRAKGMLDRILVRGGPGRDRKASNELKAFYAIRSRLSWFINTFLNFLTTHVIHAQVTEFHETFNKAKSLDEMIQFHGEHIEKIRGRCLLGANTSALHRAILSVLDMSLHFCEIFFTFAGNTTVTLDVSRQSIISKRHRSRRQRAQRKNIVSFASSQLLQDSESSDDEEEEAPDLEGHDDDRHAMPESSFSMAAASISSLEDGFSRVDKMSSELDGLVRFVRRGVESLAGGVGDAAASFSVLSFALEDWDL
ncbi:Spc98 family-domain-containing protein [Mycena pura]|uniref:Spc98 family-domain-containing protein n=1 Tax=Mycena pura TaxID=153505 RepID=A0AAD6Y7A7_9AGAR|nr:Spc98 family-domain-containing protein [Mycena pura]